MSKLIVCLTSQSHDATKTYVVADHITHIEPIGRRYASGCVVFMGDSGVSVREDCEDVAKLAGFKIVGKIIDGE